MQHKNEENFKVLANFIDDYWDRFDVSPTDRIIAEGTGLSKSTVGRYLQEMRSQGIISYDGRRCYKTTRQKAAKIKVPIFGRVTCGIPKYAEENIEEYVSLPVSLFGEGDFYLLRAVGESMVNAGIDSGDLVLVQRQETAESGQIVVALIDDEATLKRYYPEPQKNRIRLHPENDTMEDIYTDRCMIQGIVVKVIKDLD